MQRNQFLHPGVGLGHDLNVWDQSKFMLAVLKGILLVSKLTKSVGSGLPMGPRQVMPDWSDNGMTILSLRFWKKGRNRNKDMKNQSWEGTQKRRERWNRVSYLGNLRYGSHCWKGEVLVTRMKMKS